MDEQPPIIVGVDFSASSSRAFALAMTLSRAWGAPLHCVHILEEQALVELASSLDQPYGQVVKDARSDALHSLERFMVPAGTRPDAHPRVSVGHPRGRLVELVDELGAQLLVLGARGTDRTRELGPTALGAVRQAKSDVLVVRGSPGLSFETVMVCTGLGPASDEVVTRAAELVSANGVLDIVHALTPPWYRLRHSGVMQVPPATQDRYQQEARDKLERAMVVATEVNPRVLIKDALVVGANHSDAIVQTARERDADLVVVGKRSQGALANVLLGSTALAVLRAAHCSVLAVRTLAGVGDPGEMV